MAQGMGAVRISLPMLAVRRRTAFGMAAGRGRGRGERRRLYSGRGVRVSHQLRNAAGAADLPPLRHHLHTNRISNQQLQDGRVRVARTRTPDHQRRIAGAAPRGLLGAEQTASCRSSWSDRGWLAERDPRSGRAEKELQAEQSVGAGLPCEHLRASELEGLQPQDVTLSGTTPIDEEQQG